MGIGFGCWRMIQRNVTPLARDRKCEVTSRWSMIRCVAVFAMVLDELGATGTLAG
jgi:hypothetical protein